jgi:23S rRNA (guanosine2251-2'-O)-methyltransferase
MPRNTSRRPRDRSAGRRRPHKAPTRSPQPRRERLYGAHAVAAALANPSRRCHRLIATKEGAELLAERIDLRGLPLAARALLEAPQLVSRQELGGLLPPGAVHQGIVLETAPLPAVDLASVCRHAAEAEGGAKPVLVLDQITDPHNVGAILRSAAAFGVGAVIMQERNAPQTTGALAKAASGALEDVPLARVVNIARSLIILKELGFWCLGLDQDATESLATAAVKSPLALILGAEGEGMRRLTRERCDLTAKIPMPGSMASLNVSNAAAIALYEISRKG